MSAADTFVDVKRGSSEHKWEVKIDGPGGEYIFMRSFSEDSWDVSAHAPHPLRVAMRHVPGGSYHMQIENMDNVTMFVSHLVSGPTVYHYAVSGGCRALVTEESADASKFVTFYETTKGDTFETVTERVADTHKRAMEIVEAARRKATQHVRDAAP